MDAPGRMAPIRAIMSSTPSPGNSRSCKGLLHRMRPLLSDNVTSGTVRHRSARAQDGGVVPYQEPTPEPKGGGLHSTYYPPRQLLRVFKAGPRKNAQGRMHS